jgi:uncharacterized protein with HEPN domain
MPRDSSADFDDILDAISAIRDYTQSLTRDDFGRDRKTVDAVLRNLEVIGEAVKQLPADVRSAHPDVEWQKIAGLRDILIHAYFGVDLDIVWDVVSNKLPALERRIREIVQG